MQKEVYHAKVGQKKARRATVILDKVDFKKKKKKDQEQRGTLHNVKGWIYQKDIAIIIISAPNNF